MWNGGSIILLYFYINLVKLKIPFVLFLTHHKSRYSAKYFLLVICRFNCRAVAGWCSATNNQLIEPVIYIWSVDHSIQPDPTREVANDWIGRMPRLQAKQRHLLICSVRQSKWWSEIGTGIQGKSVQRKVPCMTKFCPFLLSSKDRRRIHLLFFQFKKRKPNIFQCLLGIYEYFVC
jgi:hypothetical protein